MIEGILLAAGSSTRFGSDKLMHQLNGRPLVLHALSACLRSDLSAVHVVVAPDNGRVRSAVGRVAGSENRVNLVGNSDPSHGLMSSVKCGLGALAESAEAAMILLADMPYVHRDDINRLIKTFKLEESLVVATSDGEHTHPRVIPRRLFGRFFSLGDNEKGIRVFEEDRVVEVPLLNPRSGRDIDAPGDLVR